MSDNERDIRRLLRAEADRAPQPAGIRLETVRRARLKRVGFLTSSLLVVGIVMGSVALGAINIGSDPPSAPPTGDESTTPEALNPRVTAAIDVGDHPIAVEVGAGSVWATVANAPGPAFALVRVDPATNEVVDKLPLELGIGGELAFGAGAAWVVSHDVAAGARLLRIDPQTNSVTDTIELDCSSDLDPPDCSPFEVAADDSAVWVTLSTGTAREGEVVRVDPLSNEIVARITIEQGGPRDIVVAGSSVWVNVDNDVNGDVVAGGSFVRIDPRTNQVVDSLQPNRFHLGGSDFPPVLAADESTVWVVEPQFSRGPDAPGEEVFVRIDAGTGEITGRATDVVPGSPLAVGEGGMWFYNADSVHRLNNESMEVDHSVDIGDAEGAAIVDGVLDPATGTIWVASYAGPLIRIDLR